jgi:hypothetical protein
LPDKEIKQQLSFEEIDEWVKQKYCLLCQFRSQAIEYNNACAEYGKNVERVFEQVMTVKPSVLDTPEKVQKMFETISMIVNAGGRVIVVVGT